MALVPSWQIFFPTNSHLNAGITKQGENSSKNGMGICFVANKPRLKTTKGRILSMSHSTQISKSLRWRKWIMTSFHCFANEYMIWQDSCRK